jgi:hypothetical protein
MRLRQQEDINDQLYHTADRLQLIYLLKQKDKEIAWYRDNLSAGIDRLRNDFFKVLRGLEEQKLLNKKGK